MANISDNQVGQLEISKDNKGFSYDEEISGENVNTHKDEASITNVKPNSDLNYDRILEHIGQFGRYVYLAIL